MVQNSLSGCPAKSGPLDFGTKNNFPSFFVSEKGLVHIYKNATYYFPVSYFCPATSQNWILGELRSPSVLRKVKLTDFVRRATSPKMQLAEFRFHATSKIHSLLWLSKYGNFSDNSNLTSSDVHSIRNRCISADTKIQASIKHETEVKPIHRKI